MDTRLHRIMGKINQAQKRLPELQKDFGVASHKFQLKPLISKEQIGAFEAEHKINLPQDYADFLCYLGNGGAGPYYGILPLEKCNYGLREEDSPVKPWPYPADLCQKEPWEKYRAEQEKKDPDWTPDYSGAVTICDQGCTYYALLIVTGELTGRVCYIDTEGQVPCLMKEPDFLSWYERWLDELLAGVEHFWYGLN